jgi:hypothetical protein
MRWGKLSAWRTALLTLLGFGLLSLAAFLIYIPAGFALAGVALLLIEYLTGDSGQERQARP